MVQVKANKKRYDIRTRSSSRTLLKLRLSQFPSLLISNPHHQVRRQEFFQRRALGGSRGGLPAICQFPRGGGGSSRSTPIFGSFNSQNERIIAIWLPTPMPTTSPPKLILNCAQLPIAGQCLYLLNLCRARSQTSINRRPLARRAPTAHMSRCSWLPGRASSITTTTNQRRGALRNTIEELCKYSSKTGVLIMPSKLFCPQHNH